MNKLKKCIAQLFSNAKKEPLTHQEDFLYLALKFAKTGVWSLNVSEDKIVWDEQMHLLFGIPRSFTPKHQDAAISLIHPEDQELVTKKIKAALENAAEFNVDFRVIHPDKSIHFLGIRGKVYLNITDAQKYLIGVCWDMTSRRLEEEELKAAKEIAEEASRVKSKFMAKVSHDLRSPLNGIIGFAEIMYHGKTGPISPTHKEYLGDILTSARQLLLLVNDVLDIAKVEAGKMEFHPELVNLSKIMNETRDIFHTLIVHKNIRVSIDIEPKLEKVVIDPTRLKQVIYNYVSNALKCTADNGHVTIRIRPETEDSFRLEVEDTGIGIRPEDMNRLFIEFQQLDRDVTKKYPSSGLGLALTKHIVEAQGGQVGVKSDFGKGSTFFAILPRAALSQEVHILEG